ncbi:autoinducer binding domain-containing protein [Pandoraea sp. ISTKB]|uniref:autoinducer binding domain-containing protein n=1 Tax=Pandoraea sp. ISTKB TaxID=1586708 RepID=UPI0008478864|nr:autoinducer binding domain-containing protein [Pandoraea sp. ISTKB]ODP32505.1 hypothetical protein A9762_22880 [Pandoraea sp. ISTKB]
MHLLETIHDDCTDVTDAHNLFLRVDNFSKRIGFDYTGYGYYSHRSATQSDFRMFDSYPEGWTPFYNENNLIDIDPIITAGKHSDHLLIWRDPSLPAAECFWNAATQFGLHHGVSRLSWGPHGEFGMLNFVRSQEPLSTSEIGSLRLGMGVIAHYTHEAMSRLLRPKRPPFDVEALSLREREVLLWTAEGKTADEIGEILGISTRTVNFHIRNCLDKTGCRNKVQSAIRLVMWR